MNKNIDYYVKQYTKHNLIPFSFDLGLKENGKKDLQNMPPFSKITHNNYNKFIDENKKSLALKMGIKIDTTYNVILIDIDNKNDNEIQNGLHKWMEIIKNKTINTLTQTTPSGGKHYIFKIDNDRFKNLPKSITTMYIDNILYSIDFKGENQIVIVEPSGYNDKKYKWGDIKAEIQILPEWIYELLINNTNKKIKVKKKIPEKYTNDVIDIDDIINDNKIIKNTIMIDESDTMINFNEDDIEYLLNLLKIERCNNYDSWIDIGISLFNINPLYMLLWKKWSKKSKKYTEGCCEIKWDTFKKYQNKKCFIEKLLILCKEDNELAYTDYIKKIKINNIIIKKFPDEQLELGKITVVNKLCSYTDVKNNKCLIYGKKHGNEPTMYVEMIKDLISIKCSNKKCFAKIYPCEHIQLDKTEMNMFFNANIGTIINVNINNNTVTENVSQFKKFNLFDDEINELSFRGLNGKTIPFALLCFEHYKNEYLVSETSMWYMYKNHRWNLLGASNNNLRSCIIDLLKKTYNSVLEYYLIEDGENSKSVTVVKQIINNFDDTNLIDTIMKELKNIFSNKNNPNNNFNSVINTKQNLIGFNNGVYDLSTLEFRAGKIDDYITLGVNYDYTDKYTKNKDKLIKFLEDIQPKKEEREYLLTYISTGLFGNILQYFTILSGNGSNGKSVFINLLKETFGDYFGSLRSQIMTSKKDIGDSPSPSILNMMNKKIVVTLEPTVNMKIDTSFIKLLTGLDHNEYRMCHSNDMVIFKANFLMFLVTNDIPETDKMDSAVSRRLRCINFTTEFSQNPTGNQKLSDNELNIKIKQWKQDFMLLLIDYYKKFIETKSLNATDKIMEWTNKYKELNDIYLLFLNERTKITTNDKDRVSTKTLYNTFKDWYVENNPNRNIPKSYIFSQNIKKHRNIEKLRIGEDVTSGIKNIIINTII
jgi:P4 family phage/plasmid primase-like protien